jgi:hypothetical protein
MPYGNNFDTYNAAITPSYYVIDDLPISNGVRLPNSALWSRSGTNRNHNTVSTARKQTARDGPKKLVAVTNYSGPRLPYKTWNSKIGKYIWARKPIVSYRLVNVKSKKKQKTKGLVLQPNDLHYTKTITTYPDLTACTYSTIWDYGYTHVIAGEIGCNAFRFELAGAQVQSAFRSDLLGSGLHYEATSAVQDVSDAALSKLYESAKGQVVNLAQALAERKQTGKLLGDLATRLFLVLRYAKKGNLLAASKLLFPSSSKAVAKDVLMVQYGLRPLIADISGAMKALGSPMKQEYFSVSGSHKVETEPGNALTIYENTTDTGIFIIKETCTLEYTVIVKWTARLKVTSPGIESLSNVGFMNLPTLGWELIPFSFIADWFAPIGDYLNKQDAFAGTETQWLTRTVIIKQKRVFKRQLTKSLNPNTLSATGFLATTAEDIFDCQRELITSPIEVPTPKIKNPFSGEHILNAVALIRQLS